MTYYELVNYLDDMITSPISDNDIDKIANADMIVLSFKLITL